MFAEEPREEGLPEELEAGVDDDSSGVVVEAAAAAATTGTEVEVDEVEEVVVEVGVVAEIEEEFKAVAAEGAETPNGTTAVLASEVSSEGSVLDESKRADEAGLAG